MTYNADQSHETFRSSFPISEHGENDDPAITSKTDCRHLPLALLFILMKLTYLPTGVERLGHIDIFLMITRVPSRRARDQQSKGRLVRS
jgi:hypothetical protein